ncbi:hydrolase [Sphaerisporangium album]|uniref:Hydrolase n=1 Tax=Sphaerisporangium album TaxID=509200 RepID=A0A367FAA8_9ACTN|nr:dienelactone hydrolase family protein [Sphaerisporangium album]RCG27316.1 hydrolase [Sphaerisporangium album]
MAVTETVSIPAAGVSLDADVVVPRPAHGVVLFAHGSGSGRHSPRNRHVAAALHDAELATVLVDLLTPEEERVDALTAALRFDIGLLAERLVALVDWAGRHGPLAELGVGLFGASTGAAAALVAAAERPVSVQAVVSRGGRPDLAGDHLRLVRQPTLLIVGELDPVVIELNREAMELLAGETAFAVVAGATHLFEEPGALDQVAHLARDWFRRHLRSVPHRQVHPSA